MGAGVAFNTLLLAAMGDVAPDESALSSGVVNTSFMVDGALCLAILARPAAARTGDLTAAGGDATAALNGGYHHAFLLGAVAAA